MDGGFETGLRIGTGYDVHRFIDGGRLVLGGVEIPFDAGLDGHSDADVLVHAVMDALLGAAALGDIGVHFPDSDERFKGADSMMLLEKVVGILGENGWRIGNIDAVIIAEKPMLSEFIPGMRENLAGICGTPLGRISVKATTEEGLGLGGAGIGANCVCLLYAVNKTSESGC